MLSKTLKVVWDKKLAHLACDRQWPVIVLDQAPWADSFFLESNALFFYYYFKFTIRDPFETHLKRFCYSLVICGTTETKRGISILSFADDHETAEAGAGQLHTEQPWFGQNNLKYRYLDKMSCTSHNILRSKAWDVIGFQWLVFFGGDSGETQSDNSLLEAGNSGKGEPALFNILVFLVG